MSQVPATAAPGRRGSVSVPSCHSDGLTQVRDPGAPVVALAGAPNVGKSTLFNALTGSRRDIGNWPGTTVDVGRGAWVVADGDGREIAVVDLPGAYSLDAVSPDEELTRALLVDVPPDEQPDLVVVAADATTLARSLYLVAQLRELPIRLVVAVTMNDVASRRGLAVDAEALSRAVGVPCRLIDPRHGHGLDGLADAVLAGLAAPAPAPRQVPPAPDELRDAADPAFAAAEERFEWVTGAVAASVRDSGSTRTTWSDRFDRVVTSPVIGPVVFLGVMWLVFQITTRVAAPLQGLLDQLVAGPVTEAARWFFELVGLGGTWVEGLMVDGLIAGVGMVLTFVPLMALMFVLLAVLEDSGYMARAAVVTDRLMRAIGLPGRAFIPLVVGYGCNVPAISGTRVLPDARQRLLTVLLVPFTSCTARLTVFVLLATTFFGSQAGNVVFGMYVLSIVLIVGVGALLRGTLVRHITREPLVLDLPPYHLPHAVLVLRVTWIRLRGFLQTAAGIIVVTVAAVWLLSSIPVSGQGTFGDVAVADSAYSAAAKAVSPVFVPAGFGDWHATSALMTGFVAKEAVVSSWAQTYATEEPADVDDPGELGQELRADFARTSGGHTTAAVLAFMVFVLAYTPCVATLAAQVREVGKRWMLVGIGVQLSIAWVLAVAVFQVGRLL